VRHRHRVTVHIRLEGDYSQRAFTGSVNWVELLIVGEDASQAKHYISVEDRHSPDSRPRSALMRSSQREPIVE
jgi:hypothetical protein